MSLTRRNGNVFKTSTSGNLQPGQSYTVYPMPPGGVLSAPATFGSGTSTIPLHAGHGFSAGHRFMVGTDTSTYGLIATASATQVTVSGAAVNATTGDVLVNLGNDSGATGPAWDQTTLQVYSDPGSVTAVGGGLTTNSEGEYDYYHTGSEDIWEAILTSTGQVVEVQVGAVDLDLAPTLTSLTVTGTSDFDGRARFASYPWIDVTHSDYGADPTGATDSAAAIQAAIDAASAIQSTPGSDNDSGTVVFFPPGMFIVETPLVLPRAPNTTFGAPVHLIGASFGSSTIKAGTSFPTGRGVIEWEDRVAPVLKQRIEDLIIRTPDLNTGVYYGILHTLPTATVLTNLTSVQTSRINIHLENLEFVTRNSSVPACVKLQGVVTNSTFKKIWADPSLQVATYDTMAFEFDKDLVTTGGSAYIGLDEQGCNWSYFEDIWCTPRAGGYCGLVKGRVNLCGFRNIQIGQGNNTDPVIDIENSVSSRFDGFSTEGNNSSVQIKMTNCRYIIITGLNLGYFKTAGTGRIGIQLNAVTDSFIQKAGDDAGQSQWRTAGDRVIEVDANSKRNTFHMGVIVTSGSLITDEYVDNGTDNVWQFQDHTRDRYYYKGDTKLSNLVLVGDRSDSMALRQITEEITIAAAATSTSVADLLPANSIIDAVVLRVTAALTCSATFSVGDDTPTATRFATGLAKAVNTTARCISHHDSTGAAGPVNVTARKILITPNDTPSDATGRVRVTVFYRQFVAPTVA